MAPARRKLGGWLIVVTVAIAALWFSHWLQLQLLEPVPCRDVIFLQAACAAPTSNLVWNVASFVAGGAIAYVFVRRWFAR